MATTLYKGQVPSRVKGQTTCIHHKGRQLDLYCEQCKELACTQCLSNVHNSHAMCELREIIPQKKQGITDFIDKTENVGLSRIGQFIISTNTHLKDNASTFEQLSQELKNQTNKLKEGLDRLTTQTLSLYQTMREENTKLLHQYKQDLDRYDTQLKHMIVKCKTVLQLGSNLDIYDTDYEITNSHATRPVKPTLDIPCFTPNRYPETHLKLAFGDISTTDQGVCQGQGSAEHGRSVGWSADRRSAEDSRHGHTLLPSEWQAPCDISSTCPIIGGQLWTRFLRTLTLLDRKGQVVEKVEHSDQIKDISLSPTTNTLWVCDLKNSIMELVSGHLTHRFSTDERPRCLCVTAHERVIVGMTKGISIFTTKGETELTTMSEGAEKPLVRSPYRISECPVTHNIAVVDGNFKSDGGDAKQQVVVMNMYFKKMFVYGGDIPREYATPNRKPFNPSDAAYDSVGNLVIGDFNNCCALLLSGRGVFLRIIHTDTAKLMAVGIDHKEDAVWAVIGLRNVKRLPYSKLY
ncbi:uncharacterized protein LOC110465601 [Mizuhopecten yessoensis]|uniref:uncharacterized protein LOC110465601 n=1 Tax=Mizuhopecten yessoensis TaxID=6573 RepID=UPI000B45AB70|nr:uncharacterized protein LOC110465601 [Mizuhopecten yessoensis]